MQDSYREAANTLVTQVMSTIRQHDALFSKSKEYSEHPALLQVSEEHKIEPPVSELDVSYKIQSETNTSMITSDFTITIAGPNHEALFLEVLRSIARADTKLLDSFSYQWREKENHHYITGEAVLLS